jgi:hypothetical protein
MKSTHLLLILTSLLFTLTAHAEADYSQYEEMNYASNLLVLCESGELSEEICLERLSTIESLNEILIKLDFIKTGLEEVSLNMTKHRLLNLEKEIREEIHKIN